ncbi:YfiR family protein [Endothiovibrio diazotrophicus]
MVLLLLCWGLGWAGLAGAEDASEYEIKAAYLYNFAQFVQWETGAARFPLCVLGEDPFGPALRMLEGEPVGAGQRVELRYSEHGEGLAGCRVVFIARSERGRLAAWIEKLGDGVLTVGDWSGFSAAGGIIELYRQGDRVRFAINVDAARRSGLAISAQLLGLARIVRDGAIR